MQLDVLGTDRIPPHWMRLLIPHRFFVGHAFEVLATFLGGYGWQPVAENALSPLRRGLAHGPGWVHRDIATVNPTDFLPICRVSYCGYTLLRGDHQPYQHSAVEVGLITTGRVHDTFEMRLDAAQDQGWFHTDYEHVFNGTAHGVLAMHQKAFTLGQEAVHAIIPRG